jgi:oxidase EvaA
VIDTNSSDMLAARFLQSALATEDTVLSLAEFHDWFRAQCDGLSLHVRPIPFAELDQWYFTEAPSRLVHQSGKFFSIAGLRVETDFGPTPQWEQPIIHQPEIGILGFIVRVLNGTYHFLVQAKAEPGNVNGVQLSPTVQATQSNYTRVHRGTRTRYLEYFVEPGRARILLDQLQGEQGSRFFQKRNRNMIVEVEEDVPLGDNFCWLTLGQIKRLLTQDNLVNMDARTVLSCIPFADSDGWVPLDPILPFDGFARDLFISLYDRRAARHSTREILHWLTGLRARYQLRLEPRPLDHLDCWTMSDFEIRHDTGRYFSVIAVQVEGQSREVTCWTQPLLQHVGYGLNGFLLQHINGVLHFLVRACLYPGNRELFELGSTVSRSNADEYFGHPDAPPFLDLFHDPPLEQVHYEAIQSEEGGRFYHYQNRNVLRELPPTLHLELPPNYCWMTLGQIQDLVRHGYFNIEGRNLLACLKFSDASIRR